MHIQGEPVTTFAEASHAIAEPFPPASGSVFQLPNVIAIEGNRLTVRGSDGRQLTRQIGTDKSGRQFVFISQKGEQYRGFRSFKMRPFRVANGSNGSNGE